MNSAGRVTYVKNKKVDIIDIMNDNYNNKKNRDAFLIEKLNKIEEILNKLNKKISAQQLDKVEPLKETPILKKKESAKILKTPVQ